jgi:FG-GAP repeat
MGASGRWQFALATVFVTAPLALAAFSPGALAASQLSPLAGLSAVAGVPSSTPSAKLTAPPEMNSNFGSAIAIAADGKTAVVGGETDNGGAGAAWIFVRRAGAWVQQGPKLTPSDPGRGTRFGAKVSISANGATVLIGNGQGRIGAWVFTLRNGLWRQSGRRLSPTGREAVPEASSHVTLSGDGGTAVITGEVTPGVDAQGVAWIFRARGSSWRQYARLKGTGGEESSYSAALSARGRTLILGTASPGFDGSAWIFTRRGLHWRQQGPRLPGTGVQGFGVGVALSADGRTALVGAPRVDSRPGAAFVLGRSRDGRWIRKARLSAPARSHGTYFGSSVALSADGRTAVINSPTSGGGVGYVFIGSGRRWRRTATLSGGAGFSDTLALSGDGDTVLAPPLPTMPPGNTYVFERAGASWPARTTSLLPADESGRDGADFGSGVSLSADAGTALVGGAGIWIFARSPGGWALQGSPLGSADEAGDTPSSTALSADGDTAVVGEIGERGSPGLVLVFVRAAGAWTQQGPALTPTAAAAPAPDTRNLGQAFGAHVTVSADGDTVLVGGPGDAGGSGAAWVFIRQGETWVEQGAKLTPTDEAGEGGFGGSVSLSADGNTALIGGASDNNKAFSTGSESGNFGAAWVFARSGGAWTQQAPKLTASKGQGENFFGEDVALSGDGATALVGSRGFGWVFAKSGATWSEQAMLAAGRSSSDAFGESVALSADASAALIGGVPGVYCGRYMNELCSRTGTVWGFTRSGGSWTRRASPFTGPGAFGSSVALSGNGETALIGDPVGDIASLQGGAAFVFGLTGP